MVTATYLMTPSTAPAGPCRSDRESIKKSSSPAIVAPEETGGDSQEYYQTNTKLPEKPQPGVRVSQPVGAGPNLPPSTSPRRLAIQGLA